MMDATQKPRRLHDCEACADEARAAARDTPPGRHTRETLRVLWKKRFYGSRTVIGQFPIQRRGGTNPGIAGSVSATDQVMSAIAKS
jgi:hypothetical protein